MDVQAKEKAMQQCRKLSQVYMYACECECVCSNVCVCVRAR